MLSPHDFKVDVTLLEKAKSQPQLRASEPRFYQYAWWFHFKYLAPQYIHPGDELMIVAASIGTKRKRAAFKSAVESVVNQCTDVGVPRKVAFWPVESNPCLQAADYAVWAVSRAWEKTDTRARYASWSQGPLGVGLLQVGIDLRLRPEGQDPEKCVDPGAVRADAQSPGALLAYPGPRGHTTTVGQAG